jgi:hypothetical protein
MVDNSEWLGGRYEVVRTVSEGRRASVLQAIDRVHDRLVALKVHAAAHDDRETLLAEARVLMSLTPHPGLPVVRGDVFLDDGRYVVVMNWVDGTDLQQVLDDEGDPGLPLGDVIDDLAQVAEALDHLHDHDPPIVHGDVKPANLVRRADGRVVLVDFDLAGADVVDGPVGTIGFVAPEVAAGEKAGPAADVYGLAATAVTLLNGHPPDEAVPTYPHLEPPVSGHVARVLRAALSVDPARRPRSASRLIENLRSAARAELPSGVVALVGIEVADAGRLWQQDPDEMRAAMIRLRDLRDEVVERHSGHVVAAMNEGDRTIAAFREASAAALAALELQDRVAAAQFPPGVPITLRIAMGVGEVVVADGVYSGAIVDRVVGLRSRADPGTAVTIESTAELLLGLVGHDVSIVPLEVRSDEAGPALYALTRPGRETTVPRRTAPQRQVAEPALPPSTDVEPGAAPARPRRAVVVDALQHPTTLALLAIAGVAVIWAVVLSAELGGGTVAATLAGIGLVGAAASFVIRLRRGLAARERDVEREVVRMKARRDRVRTTARLRAGLGDLASAEATEARQLLDQLGRELDHINALLDRGATNVPPSLVAPLSEFAEATYRQGVSALSDTLALLEFAEREEGGRVRAELARIDQRLADGNYTDEQERTRDLERQAARRRLLARYDRARQHVRDLLFGVERCATALVEARAELASPRAGDVHVDVDAVVENLQSTIRHVGEVQAEMRMLDDGGTQ